VSELGLPLRTEFAQHGPGSKKRTEPWLEGLVAGVGEVFPQTSCSSFRPFWAQVTAFSFLCVRRHPQNWFQFYINTGVNPSIHPSICYPIYSKICSGTLRWPLIGLHSIGLQWAITVPGACPRCCLQDFGNRTGCWLALWLLDHDSERLPCALDGWNMGTHHCILPSKSWRHGFPGEFGALGRLEFWLGSFSSCIFAAHLMISLCLSGASGPALSSRVVE
jgi:hypothetical protein